jgi:hypothetical protein
MKTKIMIMAMLFVVLVSCSPAIASMATPTPLCLDCNKDGMITPQELQDVFTKMHGEVKQIAKLQPGVAAALEQKIATLENEVVGSASDPMVLDLYAEISKMGQLEREINSAIAAANAEQAAKNQSAQKFSTTLTILVAIAIISLLLVVFLLARRNSSKKHRQLPADHSN